MGSGFTEAELAAFSRQLTTLRVEVPAVHLIETIKGIHWVKPRLRCQASFQELTPRGHFRVPAFERLLP